jgi:hypothetical protein
MQSAGLRQPVLHRHKNKTVVPAEAFAAADRLQQKKRQNITFRESPPARTESYLTAAVTAVERREQERAIDRHTAPRGIENNEGADQTIRAILRRRARTSHPGEETEKRGGREFWEKLRGKHVPGCSCGDSRPRLPVGEARLVSSRSQPCRTCKPEPRVLRCAVPVFGMS